MSGIKLNLGDLLTPSENADRLAKKNKEMLAIVDNITLDIEPKQDTVKVLVDATQLQVLRDYLIFGYDHVNNRTRFFGVDSYHRGVVTENLFKAAAAKYLGDCLKQK